jgi:hypothetical protein
MTISTPSPNLLAPLTDDPEYTFEDAAKVYGPPMTHWRLRALARRKVLKVIEYSSRLKRIRRSELLKLKQRYSK